MTPLFYIVAPSITGRVRSLARCLLHDDEQRIPAIPAAALAGPWTSAITCKAGQVIIKERTLLIWMCDGVVERWQLCSCVLTQVTTPLKQHFTVEIHRRSLIKCAAREYTRDLCPYPLDHKFRYIPIAMPSVCAG